MHNLVIHNGNTSALDFFSTKYPGQVLPCITDTWQYNNKSCATLDQKLQVVYQLDHAITHVSVAENLAATELTNLSKTFEICKIITNYENDCMQLDQSWSVETYDRLQWMRACVWGLSLSDQIVFVDRPQLECKHNLPPIVFTPGRVGTHRLMDLSGIEIFCHHDNDLISRTEWAQLTDAEEILTVVRQKFVDYLSSAIIGEKYGIMLTTKESLSTNQKICSTWQPFLVSQEQCKNIFENFVAYADLLLALRLFYNKKIYIWALDDSTQTKTEDQTKYIKNPYNKKELLQNYSEIEFWCENHWQHHYQKIISKLQQTSNILWY